MNDIVRAILIMSLTGSILTFMLFALKPFVRHRLPKSTQYYLWLVAVAALLIPVSELVSLPSATSTPPVPTITETVTRFVITQAEETERLQFITYQTGTAEYINERRAIQSPIAFISTYFVFVYPFGVLIMGLYYIINYVFFVWVYRRRNLPASPDAAALLASMSRRGNPPRLYYNPLAMTPMLFGVFRPAIILPCREYSQAQLEVILSHELTHLRRNDVIIKWLALMATALHWFNPAAWLVNREVGRACELSCDEAVIRDLDASGKLHYGNTLISVAARPKMSKVISSVTMSEDKKILKERLGAIMRSKKHSRAVFLLSALMIIVAASIAVTLSSCSSDEPDGTVYLTNDIPDNYTGDGHTLSTEEPDYTGDDAPPVTRINLYISDKSDAPYLRSYYVLDYRDAHIVHWGGDLDWLRFNNPMAIWADTPLGDFQVIGLYLEDGDDGAILATMTHAYYTIELLETPLVMEWFFTAGLFPNNGISFIDPNGERRFFAINAAYGHEDNIHQLMEFENGGVLFPPWDIE